MTATAIGYNHNLALVCDIEEVARGARGGERPRFDSQPAFARFLSEDRLTFHRSTQLPAVGPCA